MLTFVDALCKLSPIHGNLRSRGFAFQKRLSFPEGADDYKKKERQGGSSSNPRILGARRRQKVAPNAFDQRKMHVPKSHIIMLIVCHPIPSMRRCYTRLTQSQLHHSWTLRSGESGARIRWHCPRGCCSYTIDKLSRKASSNVGKTRTGTLDTFGCAQAQPKATEFRDGRTPPVSAKYRRTSCQTS